MPVILRTKGYEFYFYSNEKGEPVHVHVEKAEGQGKIWLEPDIKFAYMIYFSQREVREIKKIIDENYELLKTKWHEYFKKR